MGKKLAEHEEENVWIITKFSYENIFVILLSGLLLLNQYFTKSLYCWVEIQLYGSESFQKIICKGWSN